MLISPRASLRTDSNDDSAAYAQHLAMLKEIAASEFHLAPEVAEAIAEDVLVASMRHSPSTEWLTGAMLCAIQSHLKDAG